jgi:hypothetical protein
MNRTVRTIRCSKVCITALLFVNCRAVEVPNPGTVPGILGPIRVEYVVDPVVDGDSVWGAYLESQRSIIIDRDARGTFRRAVLAHERCHTALTDFGITMDPELEERVCDAMAALEVAR